jgi:ABC-2 type transport system ATP-binding protein
MSQYETDYGASGSDGGGPEYGTHGGYARHGGYGSDGEYGNQAGLDDYQDRAAIRVATDHAADHAADRAPDHAADRAPDRAADYAEDYAASFGGSRGGAPVVTFENVSKHYGRLRAVDGLTLDLRAGETVALLGPNGAGKSTSLDMLLALRKPTSGRIRMFGDEPYHAVKSGRVGAMLQSGGLMPEVTVRELVELVTKLHPNPEPVATTLKRAGIAQFADQRVRRLFWNSMKEEVAQGRTLLFATHYLEEADQAADRILVINRGRLLADGTPAEIKERAGAKRLSFRLDHVDEPFLLGLPGLVNLEVRRDVVQIQSRDSDATLYAILDAGYRPREIEVTSLGLEQAFLAITAEDDAANGHAAGETN